MNADGSAPARLTSGRVIDDPVGFSPDGKSIRFTRALPSTELGRESEYHEIDADGRNLRNGSPGPLAAFRDEFPSADGKRLITFGPYASSGVVIRDAASRRELRTLDIPRGWRCPQTGRP